MISLAHIVAVEVLRQQQQHRLAEHGVDVSRERWMDHTAVQDMVRDSCLAYRGTDGEGREANCPMCLQYRAGDGHEVVRVPEAHRKASRDTKAYASIGRGEAGGYALCASPPRWFEHLPDNATYIARESVIRSVRAQVALLAPCRYGHWDH